MLRLMKEKEEVSVVDDQIGSPTYAADLAEAILQIVSAEHWKPGIYHYSNEGVISWFEFASAIREIASLPARVQPIPSSAFPTPAKRPHYSVLDKTKIRQAFSLDIKDWKQSLKTCIAKLPSAKEL
jgi:dTDP-4-dehydrorhamnose reductase